MTDPEEERWLRAVRPSAWKRALTFVCTHLPGAIIVVCFLVMSVILAMGGEWLRFQIWQSLGWVK